MRRRAGMIGRSRRTAAALSASAPGAAATAPNGGAAAPGSAQARSLAAWRPTPVALVVAITVLGGALRFATLDVQSIWGDEAATMILVHRSFGGMLSHLSTSESAPPLYYVFAWLWTHALGSGPIGFRSLSALIGTLTIPVLYLCGREVSERVGVWAAALAALSPAMYYYSQEARAYGMLILFAGFAFLWWLRAVRRRDGNSLAWWGLASAIALLTHYFAVFLFIPEALILIVRLGWRRVWPPIAGVVAIGLALAPLAISQRSDGKAKWIEESSLASRIGETIKQFLVGLNGPAQVETALACGLLSLGALALVIKRAEGRDLEVGRDSAIVVAAGLALPVVLAGAHVIDVFDGRNVIATWVPYAVLVAVGLGGARSGRVGAVLGAGLCAVGLVVIVATNALPAYQRDDWRGVARALPSTAGTRAIVTTRYASEPLSIYMSHLSTATQRAVTAREIDFATLRTRRSTGAPYPPYLQRTAPPGFHLAGVDDQEAFAVTRFVAPHPRRVSAAQLLKLIAEPAGEVILQR